MDSMALPSIEDIMASKERLSPAEPLTNIVVKVGAHFAVKYGPRVSLLEAENLRFLASTSVPVPKFYDFRPDPGSNRSYIIMEYIEGQTLEEIMPSLNITERASIFAEIQQALVQLRSFEPPDYIGSIGRERLGDGIFYTDPVDPVKSGPFASEDELNEGMLLQLAGSCEPSHVELLRKCIQSTLKGHRTVFTHGDLQPKNIMVRRVDTDGQSAMFDITIIDWEMSGWYPEYWEFCNAAVWDSSKPEWTEAIQKIMTVYPQEYLMQKLIRSIVFLLG